MNLNDSIPLQIILAQLQAQLPNRPIQAHCCPHPLIRYPSADGASGVVLQIDTCPASGPNLIRQRLHLTN